MKSDLRFRRILNIAIPISLANATIPILGAVDTGVIGQTGDPVLIAAVSVGAIIVSVSFWVFGFLRMGTTGLASQARGELDNFELVSILLRGIIVGLLSGCILIIAQGPLISGSLKIFQAAADVETLATDYFKIRIWSAPFSISTFAMIGWLLAMERTKTILLLQLTVNLLNIALDLYFVLGLSWGVKGVALASLLAEIFSFFSALICCCFILLDFQLPKYSNVINFARWKKMFFVNINIFIRSIILESVIVSYIYFGSTFGTIALAANQILLHFMNITAYALDGLAFSAEVLVGISVGEKSRAKIREAALKSTLLAAVGASVLAALFFFLGPYFIIIMARNSEIQGVANEYLFWMTLTPLTGVLSWMLDGVFIGATQTVYMRKAMIQSFILYIVFITTFYPSFGNHGLWLSINLFFIARAVCLVRYYPKIESSCIN